MHHFLIRFVRIIEHFDRVFSYPDLCRTQCEIVTRFLRKFGPCKLLSSPWRHLLIKAVACQNAAATVFTGDGADQLVHTEDAADRTDLEIWDGGDGVDTVDYSGFH